MEGLVLHCGADRVSLDEVRAVETPPATCRGTAGRLFVPIPHIALYEEVCSALCGSGYTITEEAHALTKEGARYFALLQVARSDRTLAGAIEEYSLIFGLRNGHDGGFAAGLALGSRVFVCDNLSFSGEVNLARKHTRFIMRDLPNLVHQAIGQLGDQRHIQEKRFETYKSRAIEDRDAHSLILRGLLGGVLPETRVRDVVEHWTDPPHEEFKPRTVWSLFNSFTEALKPCATVPSEGTVVDVAPVRRTNLSTLSTRTQRLHGLLDMYCGLSMS